jgi:hypothetical protein
LRIKKGPLLNTNSPAYFAGASTAKKENFTTSTLNEKNEFPYFYFEKQIFAENPKIARQRQAPKSHQAIKDKPKNHQHPILLFTQNSQ